MRGPRISRSWLDELITRYHELGEEGPTPQSKRPHPSPTWIPAGVEEEIVALRKELSALGFDARAHTMHYHLGRSRPQHACVSSVATIWRVLSRRCFVTPQPYTHRISAGCGASPRVKRDYGDRSDRCMLRPAGRVRSRWWPGRGELGISCNDVNFCLRLGSAEWRVVWTPFSALMHHDSFATTRTFVSGAS